jgi:hypothetical protein
VDRLHRLVQTAFAIASMQDVPELKIKEEEYRLVDFIQDGHGGTFNCCISLGDVKVVGRVSCSSVPLPMLKRMQTVIFTADVSTIIRGEKPDPPEARKTQHVVVSLPLN